MTKTWLALPLLSAAICLAGDKLYSNSYKGQAPPELQSAKEDWINAPKSITLKELKGKVVYLEFGFLH